MNRMRDRSALRQWELRFGPNMTPMVDVVMVILIFFMASTAFVGPEWFLRAGLPVVRQGVKTDDPFDMPPKPFDVEIFRGPQGRSVATGIGLHAASLEEMETRLRSLAGEIALTELVVIFRPRAEVPYRDVVRLKDAASRAGITRIGLDEANADAATPPPPTDPAPVSPP